MGRGIHPPNPMMYIAYSPYFHQIYTFTPISAKFTFFAFPYFDHDAFIHVLDAPVDVVL